jgi:hypothetical protein
MLSNTLTVLEFYSFTTLAGSAENHGSAGGTGRAARFYSPYSVAVDSAGNVFVADTYNHMIRKVTPAGAVTTLAGLAGTVGSADGTGSDARFERPFGVAVDSVGTVYVADRLNCTIRKVTPAGVVTTLAGLAGSAGSADGTGSNARFGVDSLGRGHLAVAVDGAGTVYVADSANLTIRKVTPAGFVTTLAEIFGGCFRSACVGPQGVAVDSLGNLYVADPWNNTIRKGYPAPRILNSGPGFGFNGGRFGFNLTGPSRQSVVIEASADLVNWLPLWTNTFTFPAALNFSDRQSDVFSNRFYRAVSP